MRFIFRSPVFPVVFKIGGGAVCAASAQDLKSYLKRHAPKDKEMRPLIDYRWEGFSLYSSDLLVSPLTTKKRYSKREFLSFCGVSDEQLNQTDFKKYTRQQIFDYVFQEAHK